MTPANSTPDKIEKLTITLTGRTPVKITKDEWPVIASADDTTYGESKLIVRQHQDGRTIVYAIYKCHSPYEAQGSKNIRGGEVLAPDADIPAAIERVAEFVAGTATSYVKENNVLPEWRLHLPRDVFARLAHECIADLPAEEL